jgi:transcriptional regulator with XRE-family HTH domain
MSSDIKKRFGARVRELRLERKMSQIALAEKAGIEQQHLSNLELGKKEAKIKVIEMLAQGLGISLRQLFWDL